MIIISTVEYITLPYRISRLFKYNKVTSYLHNSTFLRTHKMRTCKYISEYRTFVKSYIRIIFLIKIPKKKIEFQTKIFLAASCCNYF